MSGIHFGEIEPLLALAGVHGAAFFQGEEMRWNRIPNFIDSLVLEIGLDLRELASIYREVGREIFEVYFCFQATAWLGILRDGCLLLIHLGDGASLGRVISAGGRFFGVKPHSVGVS